MPPKIQPNDTILSDFLHAAKKGDLLKLRLLKDKINDINALDEETGRTALHFAALNNNSECYDWLLSAGAKEDIEDKMGFRPYETWLNPQPFHPLFTNDALFDTHQQYRFIISEKNCLLPNSARLVYIERIEEINLFIQQNPEISRVGFIVRKPNILRRFDINGDYLVRDIHVAPIYFERRGQQEYFIHIDSVFGKYFLLPKSDDAQKTRFHIYSPFNRQTTGRGCFEDAVVILLKIMTDPDLNFLKWCTKKENNTPEPLRIHPLKQEEYARLLELRRAIQGNHDLVDEYLAREKRNENALQVSYYKKHNSPYVAAIFRLTEFPVFLLPHVAFYSTMRQLRVKSPGLFMQKMHPTQANSPTYLEYILKHGSLRVPGIDEKLIAQNLQDDNPLFDFKGKDFPVRQAEFIEYRKAKTSFIYTLFNKHLAQKTDKKPEQIAHNIAEFVSGMSSQ